jgi:hypothetical protein
MTLSIAALGLINVLIKAPSHSFQMQWLFYFASHPPLSLTMMKKKTMMLSRPTMVQPLLPLGVGRYPCLIA